MAAEWTPVDVNYVTNPKMVAAGADGKLLHLAALCYCQAHTTDGVIPKGIVPSLVLAAPAKKSTVHRLVSGGLWLDEGDHFRVKDWHDWNDPKEQVDARKARERKRKQEWRRRKAEAEDAGRDASRDGDSPVDVPVLPAPAPAPSSPSSRAANGPSDLVAAAVEAVMQRKGHYASSETKGNPEGWLAAARAGIERDLRGKHGNDLGRLIREGAPPDRIADLIEPRTVPAVRPPAHDPDCPECGSPEGWKLDERGEATRCTRQRLRAVQ